MHDDLQGARLAIKHLLATGRHRIAHITGPARHLAARDRAAGAKTAIEAAGETLVLGEPLMGEWSERWGREATTILMRTGEEFNGIFCGSDQIARGVADALREAGRPGTRGGRHRRRRQLGGDGRRLPPAADHDRPQPQRTGPCRGHQAAARHRGSPARTGRPAHAVPPGDSPLDRDDARVLTDLLGSD